MIKKAGGILLVLCCLTTSLLAIQLSSEDLGLVESYAKAYAITADQSSLESALKNPAAIQSSDTNNFLINVNQSYDGTMQQAVLGFGLNLSEQSTLALVMPLQIISDIYETELIDGAAVQTDTASMTSVEAIIAYSKEVSNMMSIGASLKSYADSIFNETAFGYAFDLGALLSFKYLDLALSAQDLMAKKSWSTGTQDHFSARYNLGFKLNIVQHLSVLTDITHSDNLTAINVASSLNVTHHLTINAGVRDLSKSNQLRAGLSLNLNRVSIHYAYGHHEQLNDSHKIGVNIDY